MEPSADARRGGGRQLRLRRSGERRAEELARITCRHRVRGARPGNVDDAAEDDEHEFDQDDYPTFEVEEVGDARVEDGRGADVGTSARASSKAFVSEIARSGARAGRRGRARAKTVIEKRDGEDM